MEKQLIESLERLETEKQNLNTIDIDLYSTMDILKTINNEDKTVAYSIEKKLDEIEALTNAYINTLENGGRVFYIGAGTSGRMAFIDAAEIMPTYGIEEGIVEPIMCGGMAALKRAKEAAEDQASEGTRDLKEKNFSSKDMLIGIAASGRTPYVMNALEYAKSLGAVTGSISCVSNAQMSKLVDYPVEVVVGQEVVLGSTRMKAGTAQKLILNMISTTVFVRMGRVYKNCLLNTIPTTEKTYIRGIRAISNEAGISFELAKEFFDIADRNAILAMCMIKTGYSKEDSIELLRKYKGRLRIALKDLGIED